MKLKLDNDRLRYLIFPLLMLMALPAAAQDKDKDKDKEKDDDKRFKVHPILETGVLIGGQVDKDVFTYQSALAGQIIAGWQVDKRVYYGLGVGVDYFRNQTFVPMFVDFKGFNKKEKSSFALSGKLGYALIWNEHEVGLIGYKYKGGVMFSPGVGYRLVVNDDLAMLLLVSYIHQFASIDHTTLIGETYNEKIDFDFFSFRIGIIL